jgi:NAD(P)-dependent dehydrogenase (short-subunit alcohol dehydrogenase family)
MQASPSGACLLKVSWLAVCVGRKRVPSYGHCFEPLAATAEEWDTVMRVNARGMFLCYKYAAVQMIRQGGGGRIIGAASICAKRGMCTAVLLALHLRESPRRDFPRRILRLQVRYQGIDPDGGYVLAPALRFWRTSVHIVVRCFLTAQELGPYGITCNAYAPLHSDSNLHTHTLADMRPVGSTPPCVRSACFLCLCRHRSPTTPSSGGACFWKRRGLGRDPGRLLGRRQSAISVGVHGMIR